MPNGIPSNQRHYSFDQLCLTPRSHAGPHTFKKSVAVAVGFIVVVLIPAILPVTMVSMEMAQDMTCTFSVAASTCLRVARYYKAQYYRPVVRF
jgi:hypothetical protein